VGETLADREAGQTDAVVLAQLEAVLELAGIEAFEDAVIAYEPVWAIGTGKTATPEQAQAVHASIRARIRANSDTIAGQVRVIYGGSVKPENAPEILSCEDIDGGLIGGASLSAESFLGICQAVL
jgi:triosephosphate isomerase